jgi:hypothetical protein
MDDRDRRGRIPYRKSGGRRDNDDHVDFQLDHLRRKFLKSLDAALCIAALNNEVLPLGVSELPQALEQRVIKLLISVGDKSDPPNFA